MVVQVAWVNGVLFAGSIAGFLWILIFNASRRRAVIAEAIHLPLPGCPSIHSGIEWVQWVPGAFIMIVAHVVLTLHQRPHLKVSCSLLRYTRQQCRLLVEYAKVDKSLCTLCYCATISYTSWGKPHLIFHSLSKIDVFV